MRINFNPQSVKPYGGSFTVLPNGSYNVQIVNEAEVENRNGSGKALQFEYEVLDGEYKGQRVRERFNLFHSNENAVRAAQSRLVAIANVIGLPLDETRKLHRKPFNVCVSVIELGGHEYNNIDAYSKAQRVENSNVESELKDMFNAVDDNENNYGDSYF